MKQGPWFFQLPTVDDGSPLDIKVFRWIALAAGLLAPISIPLNTIFHVPPLVNVGAAVLSIGSLLAYWESLHGRHHKIAYIIAALMVLDLLWWANGGAEGSITYFFIPGMLFVVALLQGATRLLLVILLVLNVTGLFLIDFYILAPDPPYRSEADALGDHAVSIVQALIISAASMWLIIGAYNKERDRTASFAADLVVRERNYRNLVENARSVIARMDLQGNVMFVNRFAEELFGIERADIIGKPAAATLMPGLPIDANSNDARVLSGLLQASATPEFETEYLRKDGRRIRLRWTGQRVDPVGGEPEHVLCVGDDVTDRHVILERLRLTQTSVDTSADQIIWANAAGRIFYANKAAAEALGYSQAEMRELAVSDITDVLKPADWSAQWNEFKRRGTISFEGRERRRDGVVLPVEVTATYLNVLDREFATAILRDISERKRADMERKALQDQLFHAQKMEAVGRLAGGVAHEFNNVLQIVTGFTTLAKQAAARGADAGKDLDRVLEASKRGSAITAQFLALGRRSTLKTDALDLPHLLEELADMLRPVIGENIELQFSRASSVGTVLGDSALLQQMITNLCLNACDAMPAGGRLHLHVRDASLDEAYCRQNAWAQVGDYVEMTLSDTGTGIEPDIRGQIFEPFFTTKEVGRGSGLGLSVVLGIVEQHAGLIAVDSTVGEGSTFRIFLPRVEAPVPDKDEPAPARPAAGGSETILVGEDEPAVRELLIRTLEAAGYRVLSAADGAETIQVFQHHANEIALVVLDAIMPKADFSTVIPHLRGIRPDVHIILSSGYSAETVGMDALADQGIRLISKPYSPELLLNSIREVMDDARKPVREE